jgi:uncharacterized protein YndB with AHSA1/START domain
MAASNASLNPAGLPMERELVITRVFDAPRELVFRAWTDPEHMARWWGPKVFTNRVERMDVRPGGAWRIIMCAPDGAEYPAQGVYREIVPPERLVFTNLAVDKDGNVIIDGFTTVTFDDQNGKTKLTLQTRGTAKVDYAAQYLQGMEMGWTQSLDKLGESLEKASDREIVITRVFDAPRDLVFQTWTNPRHLDSWWGPKGFTTTTHEIDIRTGSLWRFMMHGPDGVDYPNKIVYLEIAKPALLVYDHGDDDRRHFRVTVTFAEENGKTRLTMRSLFPTAEEREMVVTKFHAIEGGNQTLDRFGEQLAKSVPQQFSFSREFDAPRDLVWKAVTEPERLKHWWGPKGFTIFVCNVDLRPGGEFLYAMRSPDGHEMWGKWVYREIAPPERLSSVVSFTDKDGNILRHPASPTWPLEVLNTMTLSEHGGKTTMTISGYPINATEEELKTYDAGRGSMKQGFNGTLDQLETYLAKVKQA